MTCPNCGESEAHFIPPSFGDAGFYMCHSKECAGGVPGPNAPPGVSKIEGCNCDLSRPIPRSRQGPFYNKLPIGEGLPVSEAKEVAGVRPGVCSKCGVRFGAYLAPGEACPTECERCQ